MPQRVIVLHGCSSVGGSEGAEGVCKGACARGWSNDEITNVGTANNMHGPWGSSVNSVSKTFAVPSGISQCTVTWTSWGFNARDNEVDRLYIDDTEVWSHTMSGGDGVLANAAEVGTYLASNCAGTATCRGRTIKRTQYVTASCSDTITLRFTSDIRQSESDESWGFQNVAVDFGAPNYPSMIPLPASTTQRLHTHTHTQTHAHAPHHTSPHHTAHCFWRRHP